MQPVPATGAARPLKLYTYVQKYACVKSAVGTLVASSTPVWLPIPRPCARRWRAAA